MRTITLPRGDVLRFVRLSLQTLTEPGDHLDVPAAVTEPWLQTAIKRLRRRTGRRYRITVRPTGLTVTCRAPLD